MKKNDILYAFLTYIIFNFHFFIIIFRNSFTNYIIGSIACIFLVFTFKNTENLKLVSSALYYYGFFNIIIIMIIKDIFNNVDILYYYILLAIVSNTALFSSIYIKFRKK